LVLCGIKLVKAINSYNSYGKNEIKLRIIDIMREKRESTTKELSKLINRDRRVVWKNLNKLKKEGIIEKKVIGKKGAIEKVLWQINKLPMYI
jgi:predicted transcriptional regulator